MQERFFEELIYFCTKSTANLRPSTFWTKIMFFFYEILFFQKAPSFGCFWKCYYFSRILQQIWYNLLIKKFSNLESDISVGNYQLASKRKKNVRVELMISPPYSKYGLKK